MSVPVFAAVADGLVFAALAALIAAAIGAAGRIRRRWP